MFVKDFLFLTTPVNLTLSFLLPAYFARHAATKKYFAYPV